MKLVTTVKELQEYISSKKNSVGFVPTMGAIHDGHLSLVKRAREENQTVIVSIFVNPTQFLPGEDLDKYPRQLEADKQKCEKAGVDLIFAPNISDMYGKNEPKIIADAAAGYILEGKSRPGHFDGMLTIVLKLLNLVKPSNAYFGKKDAQQLLLIKKMAKAFFLDTNIVECVLVRERNGLAMSSRNAYLSNEERKKALLIHKALNHAKMLIAESDERNGSVLKEQMTKILEPLDVEYVEIVSKDLKRAEKIVIDDTIILIAAKVGSTRLIDNLWL